MEQVIVKIYGRGENPVYEQATAWIQVNSLMGWSGYLIAAENHELSMSSGRARAPFMLRTVDGRGGEIVITSANIVTREVYFEGSGPFGFLQ